MTKDTQLNLVCKLCNETIVKMCGNDVVCLHGNCVVEAINGEVYEHCQCYAMYSGSQCSFRKEMVYWELPVACALIFILLGISTFVSIKSLAWLRLPHAKHDTFAFPRRWEGMYGLSFCGQVLRGRWSGPTRRGLPTKPFRGHVVENIFIILVVLLELLPWVQLIALSFLPVVPWPKSSREIARTLRLSLLYPLWSHLEPNQFPTLMLYGSLGFVPGILLVACILGVKRFPLFKPQPKNSPTEDFCTLVLRLYSEWLVLPVMIGLLLPLECGVIGYNKDGNSGMVLPTLNGSCFTLWQGAMVAAGTFVLILFCVTSSVIVIQLSCEPSVPQPTLWTYVRYTQVAHSLKAPLAMSVVASMNANALVLCTTCLLISLVLGVMNAKLNPCVLSLVNGIRIAGALMAFWTSLLALVTALVDDPGATIVFEAWSLGAIAISSISILGLFLYHSEDHWRRLTFTTKETGTSSLFTATKAPKEVNSIPKILPARRSSAAERIRSRSKSGNLPDSVN